MTLDPCPQALDGIRVLDLSGTLAGSVAAMLLGDYGAQVVHIDPPSLQNASPLPGAPLWHRNKTCSSVDWHSAAEVATLRALLQGADVVITTDADVDDLLHIGACTNEGLIRLSMPTRVPLTAGGIEVDSLLWAASGHALRQPSFDGGPVDSVYPLVQYTQGAWAATSTVAALYERVHSGLGQQVVVDGFHGAVLAGVTVFVIDPTSAPMITSGGPNRSAVTAPYRCADGEWVFFIALGRSMRTAFEAIGLPDLMDDPRVQGMPANLLAPENRSWVTEAISAALAAEPQAHWLEALTLAGCPIGVIAAREDWLDHPQVVALGQRKVLRDPVDGEVVMGGALVSMTQSTEQEPRPRRIVPLSELPSWSASTGAATTGDQDRQGRNGPLDGVRILNIGLFIAGPFGGMLLAELGAEVTKVEKLAGSNNRDGGFHFIRGQRSLAMDLHDPAGHSMLLELVAQSDAVMDNFRPGVLERLGLTHSALARVQPDIITSSITSFGDVGPLAGDPGMDPLVQALSGMMAAQGGDSEPVGFATGPTDLMGGLASALGVCLALFHRARGGGGQRVHTSLVGGSVFLQSGELVRSEARTPVRRGGRDYPGPSAIDRFYGTLDGHVRVHAADRDGFVKAGLLPDPAVPEGSAVDEISAALAHMSRAEALALLASAEISAVPARHLNELPKDAQLLARGYLTVQESIDDTTLYLPGRLARFGRTQRQDTLRTPGVGEHSRDLLTEAGLPADTIDAAISSGRVKQGGPVIWFSEAAGQW